MSENYCDHGVPTKSSPWRFTSIDVKDCPYCEIDRLGAQIAEWHKVFGHLSKDADTAGNMINEGIAERDKEIEKLTHAGNRMASDCNKLFNENAALRVEVERLKENECVYKHVCGKNDEFNQVETEACKQAAREIIQYIANLPCKDLNQRGLIHELRQKFGLEG